jgi:hypothetical protein
MKSREGLEGVAEVSNFRGVPLCFSGGVIQDFYSIADLRRLAADLSREATIERRAKSRELRLSKK